MAMVPTRLTALPLRNVLDGDINVGSFRVSWMEYQLKRLVPLNLQTHDCNFFHKRLVFPKLVSVFLTIPESAI
jgi:hypothetical protein